MKVIVLGTGGSAGVPIIGCDCAICTSDNPKNRRSRVSVYIEAQGQKILIDSSPDLRQQALTHGIDWLDAIVYTHDHADHTHGIDDIRPFNYRRNAALPVYADPTTMASLKTRFPYIFLEPRPEKGWFRPCAMPHLIDDTHFNPFHIGELSVKPFPQIHGRVNSLGFRIGDFAYSTDVNIMPEESFETLAGIDTWVVDCLRYAEAPSHSHLEQTLRWIERVRPRRAILTHMSHEMEYETLRRELPHGVEPGYDGLSFGLND